MQPYEDLNIVSEVIRTILAPADVLSVTHVPEGLSTAVYRVDTTSGLYYLRVLPEADASFAPEVAVHQRLYALGLHVPQVICFQHYNESLQRSLMLTTSIRGNAIGYTASPELIQQVLHDAGRELAVVNQVEVQGFGWIKRDLKSQDLSAEYQTLSQWLHEHFQVPIQALYDSGLFASREVNRIFGLLATAQVRFQHEASVLAHGDFDVTHIYYDECGYTGMIDFGEIRGAYRIYDLGHFAIENGHLLQYLIKGYEEVIPLSDETQYDIKLTGTLVAARRVGRRVLQRQDAHPPDVTFVKRLLGEECS